jgi:predicted NACHT family NTPase
MPIATIASLVITEAIKASVKPLFDEFIKPNLGTINAWLEERKLNKKVDAFESEFLEYLGGVYHATEFINVLIFPNSQIRLNDFYEPLYIVSLDSKSTYEIDKINLDFLHEYKKIIISDSAGMGKSTIVKWVARQCVQNYLGVPVLVELKKITPQNTLLQEIFSQFGKLGSELDTSFILKLLTLGKFIIIFDGYDEIAQEFLGFVTEEIAHLTNKARDNYYILTSRPDPALATFGSFMGFKIKKLTHKQSDAIIRKCDRYSPEPIGEELIRDTRMRENTISDFLTNPFLVTLLYNCYFYNKNIPINKSEFYEEVYNALYKRHDLSKEKFERAKRSGLDSYSFRQVLRKFAFNGAKKGKSDYLESSLVEAIKEAQETLVGIPAFDAINFCDDLVKQVPLMVRDGLHIKWSHKSLQDYFAAEYICQTERKSDIVNALSKSANFYRNANLFDFIIEKDYALVREHVLYDILVSYRDFVNHIKKINLSISSENAEDLASYLFDCEIFATKNGSLIDEGKLFKEVFALARGKVSTLMHEGAIINDNKFYLYISDSSVSTIMKMIVNKKADDLLILKTKFKEDKDEKFVFSEELNLDALVTNLSSDSIISILNEELLEEFLKFLSYVTHRPKINHRKAMDALRDIEQMRVRKKAEDASFF